MCRTIILNKNKIKYPACWKIMNMLDRAGPCWTIKNEKLEKFKIDF
jgi:hypothetical protein